MHMSMRPVNPADIFSLMGVYPGFQPKEHVSKAVPGLEGVGVVAGVGEGVSNVSVGQRVVGTPFNTVEDGVGTWQEYLVAKSSHVVPVPDAIPDESAAQLWVNPVAVYGMFDELQIPKGEYLLQTAAGSVLGRQVIQYAKHVGIKTINVVRRSAQVDELKSIGADEVIVSVNGEGVADAVKEITGGNGAYAGIDAVGGDVFSAVGSSVRAGGTVLIYGAMSGLNATFSIIDPLFRKVTLKGFWLADWFHSRPREEVNKSAMEIFALLEKGVLSPYAGDKVTLDNIADAIAKATSDARGGKVLLIN